MAASSLCLPYQLTMRMIPPQGTVPGGFAHNNRRRVSRTFSIGMLQTANSRICKNRM